MKLAVVDWARCLGCRRCPALKAFRVKALFKLEPAEPAAVEPRLCNGCGRCIPACPFQAIFLQR